MPNKKTQVASCIKETKKPMETQSMRGLPYKRLKGYGQEKALHKNLKKRKKKENTGRAILISTKKVFKTKTIIINNKGHYIMIK